jgi:hypothetical protein
LTFCRRRAEGAAWIATRRLSDPKLKTDLSFRINPSAKGATVFVLFSTGSYPTVTLKGAGFSDGRRGGSLATIARRRRI